MRAWVGLVLAVSLAASSAGCIWFNERDLSVRVENDLVRIVNLRLRLDRVAISGSTIDTHTDRLVIIAGLNDVEATLKRVGNGDYHFTASFTNKTDDDVAHRIHIHYGEGDGSSTRLLVKIRGEGQIEARTI